MYRILIIDDEKGITDGLKLIFQRDIPKCIVVGVAYNGKEGLEMAVELKPDIILTDIRMPQVDGLEMVSRLKDMSCKARFIILSGYSEFKYAKKAIALGVKFYINKPVDEEELYDVINKACTDIDDERESALKIRDLEDNVRSNRESMKELILRDILVSAGDNSSSIKDLLDSCDFPTEHKQYVCAIIELSCDLPYLAEKLYTKLNDLKQIHLSSYSDTVLLPYMGMQFALIISHQEIIDYSTLTAALYRIKDAAGEMGISAVIGLGMVCGNAGEINTSFVEARHALDYKVIKGTGTVITYNEIQNITGKIKEVSKEEIIKLEGCIESMDIQGCVLIINGIFDEIAGDAELSLAALQLQCLDIILLGIRKTPEIQFQLSELLGRNILSLESISRFKTLEQLKNWLINTIKGIVELKSNGKLQVRKDIITEIKSYIADNFDKEISLTYLAAKFYMNPFYISQLFKEKTGDTYLNYLMKFRVDRAKELLRTTDFKVYEVCELVGYSDTNYFSKLFEKFTGHKPSKYRKDHDKN